MSNNLIKTWYRDFSQEETRILDMNELVEERLEAIQKKAHDSGAQGFVPGLNASELNVDAVAVNALLNDDDNSAASVVSGNIIKAANEDAAELKAQAEQAAQRIIDDARKQADEIISRANEQANLDRDKIHNEAKTQGYEEGRAQAEKENELIRGELDRTRRDLNKSYAQKLDEMEPEFIDTITGIYEHIFNVELGSYRDIVIYLIEGAMRSIDGRSLLVHVSKDDYAYVSMQKKQITAETVSSGTNVEIVEDMTLAKNECFIETEAGIFDCGLGTELAELSKKLRILSYEK